MRRRHSIKDETGWRLEPGLSAESPDAIERLVRSRVDRLDPVSHDVLVAGVGARAEFGLKALGTVTDLGGGVADDRRRFGGSRVDRDFSVVESK